MPDAAIEHLDPFAHRTDLRECWQGRALAAAQGPMAPVILSVLAHSFDDAMPTLLLAVFGNLDKPPFWFCTAGKVAKTGHVCADLVTPGDHILKMCPIFRSVAAMQDEFRRFADELKLDDADRRALFGAAKRWLVCDFRLDPTMDPADPDAKRLTVN